MDPKAQSLVLTRRKINAAKARLQKSWKDVFGTCDKDNSGTLDFPEFEEAVRKVLNINPNGLGQYELRTIFQEIDADRSGGVDIEELLNYLTKGPRTEEEIASRARMRIQRVRRALKMAFATLGTCDAALRRLFVKVDMDSDNTLSMYEFQSFVRMELKLSFWEVNNSDVDEFYKFMDKNSSGSITIDELLAFVKTNNTGRPNSAPNGRVEAFSFAEPSRPSSAVVKKKKTFKQTLLEDSFRSASLPDLSRMRYTASVVSQGRGVMPATRSSLAKDSQMFFDPGGPARRLRQGA